MKIIYLALTILLLTNIGLAQVNLTIQSDNEQYIKINNVSNNILVSSINSSQTQNLTYDNYIIKMYPDTKNLNNGTVFKNLNNLVGDRYQFIWIFVFLALSWLGYRIIKSNF